MTPQFKGLLPGKYIFLPDLSASSMRAGQEIRTESETSFS
jgi:hypothetical protein